MDGVTVPARTLVDCLRLLRFDEALAIADSALRQEAISGQGLVRLMDGLRGAGAARARRVAALATPLAANPFESVLRAISTDAPGLHLVPQVPITAEDLFCRPDLVDVDKRIVVEAESNTWHNANRHPRHAQSPCGPTGRSRSVRKYSCLRKCTPRHFCLFVGS